MPAEFEEKQRNATSKAAELAGEGNCSIRYTRILACGFAELLIFFSHSPGKIEREEGDRQRERERKREREREREREMKTLYDRLLVIGMDVRRVISEPTAAALAYGLHKKKGVESVVVVDLGKSFCFVVCSLYVPFSSAFPSAIFVVCSS